MPDKRRPASFFCALLRGKMPGRSRFAVAKLERCAYTASDFFLYLGVVMAENIGIIAGGKMVFEGDLLELMPASIEEIFIEKLGGDSYEK